MLRRRPSIAGASHADLAAADRYPVYGSLPGETKEHSVARVVVDVVLKPEILDPQGQAILNALRRLGVEGVQSVRQGKHFELELDDSVDEKELTRIADTMLANPVIEDFTVRR